MCKNVKYSAITNALYCFHLQPSKSNLTDIKNMKLSIRTIQKQNWVYIWMILGLYGVLSDAKPVIVLCLLETFILVHKTCWQLSTYELFTCAVSKMLQWLRGTIYWLIGMCLEINLSYKNFRKRLKIFFCSFQQRLNLVTDCAQNSAMDYIRCVVSIFNYFGICSSAHVTDSSSSLSFIFSSQEST